MEKLIINACPVCGSTHLKRVMTCTDFYASGEQFELCSCEDCGFTFTQGVPVEAEIGKYYETPDYISHTDTRKGAMNTIYHYVRSYMLGRKARLVAREAHVKEGVCSISGREPDTLPTPWHAVDGRWKQWRKVRRHVLLQRSISIWT